MTGKALIGAVFVLMIASGSTVGQNALAYPTREEVIGILADTESVLKEFEEVSDRINFSQWNAPYGVISQARTFLDGIRSDIRASKLFISQMQGSRRRSATDLFHVYATLADIAGASGNLAQSVGQFSTNYELASDLFTIGTTARKVETKYSRILSQELEAQDSELQACRSRVP
jgi:hypothetical protein